MAGETVAETIAEARARRKRSKRRKTIAVICLAVAVVVGGVFGYRALTGTETAAITYTTQAAQKVTIINSVSGTGSVNLTASKSLTSEVSGTVTGLAVALGDTVTKDQVLFKVVNEDLETAVTQATNSYNQAVNSLEQAELSLTQAQKDLDDLYDKYNEESWGSADSGRVQLASLNKTPSSTTTIYPGSTTTTVPSTTTSTISELEIRLAEQKVTSAQLSVTVAQTNVELAQMALDDAKENVTKQEVTAPQDGTITAINVSEGDDVSSSSSSNQGASSSSAGAALVITDLSKWDVTVTLAETDISSVKVGQRVTLTFDALPDVSLTGRVSTLDTTGSNSSGVVSYTATIVPDVGNASVLGGMTVTVDIITLAVADVIGVPNAAVKTASDGTYYVQLLENGQPVDQTVEVGASDDTYTEIKSGLTEGQEVITKTVNPAISTSTTARGGNGGIINGGGFPSDGGAPPGGPGG